MTTCEQWRPVPGFVGLYEVSSRGRVKSLERKCAHRAGERRVRERILKPQRRATTASGKIQAGTVNLHRDDGLARGYSIARLVLLAFVGEPPVGHVAHIMDGMPEHVYLGNLEWATPAAVAIAADRRAKCAARVADEAPV